VPNILDSWRGAVPAVCTCHRSTFFPMRPSRWYWRWREPGPLYQLAATVRWDNAPQDN